MLTSIGAIAGIVAAAYFAGIVGCTIPLDAIHGKKDPNKSKKMAVFFRLILTTELAVPGILIICFDADLRHSLGTIWLTVTATAILAFVIPGPVTITSDGLLRKNSFRKDTLIRWDALDHYEIKKGAQGVSDVYTFERTMAEQSKSTTGPRTDTTYSATFVNTKRCRKVPFTPTDWLPFRHTDVVGIRIKRAVSQPSLHGQKFNPHILLGRLHIEVRRDQNMLRRVPGKLHPKRIRIRNLPLHLNQSALHRTIGRNRHHLESKRNQPRERILHLYSAMPLTDNPRNLAPVNR